jgi:phage terminase small subunit
MTLTTKQQKFVDSYVESGNATKAALDAGYSKKTARVIGQENLLKPALKSAIEKRMSELESHKIATADEVLKFYTSVMRAEITETVVVGGPDGAEAVDVPPNIKTRLAAGREIIKRYPAGDELLKAQIRKTQAEADIAEAHAAEVNAEGSAERTVIVDDVPNEIEDD